MKREEKRTRVDKGMWVYRHYRKPVRCKDRTSRPLTPYSKGRKRRINPSSPSFCNKPPSHSNQLQQPEPEEKKRPTNNVQEKDKKAHPLKTKQKKTEVRRSDSPVEKQTEAHSIIQRSLSHRLIILSLPTAIGVPPKLPPCAPLSKSTLSLSPLAPRRLTVVLPMLPLLYRAEYSGSCCTVLKSLSLMGAPSKELFKFAVPLSPLLEKNRRWCSTGDGIPVDVVPCAVTYWRRGGSAPEAPGAMCVCVPGVYR